uniref:Uncharacterized protein n=1 Tax=Oryza barthii TaxID=65489 RepID=A0A0D3HCG5_9ORYZ
MVHLALFSPNRHTKSFRPNLPAQPNPLLTLSGQEAKLLTRPAVPFHRLTAREQRDRDKAIDRAHEHRVQTPSSSLPLRQHSLLARLFTFQADPGKEVPWDSRNASARVGADETPPGNTASSTSFVSARTPPPSPSQSIRCFGSEMPSDEYFALGSGGFRRFFLG